MPVDALQLVVDDYYPNSALVSPTQLPSPDYPHLRVGPMAVAVQMEKTYKENERNLPSAAVSIFQSGQLIGTWSLVGGIPAPGKFSGGREELPNCSATQTLL